MPQDDWDSWGRHVLKELERLNTNMEAMEQNLIDSTSKLKIEIAVLQVKSAVWGATAGMIPVFILILMKYVK